MSFAGLGPTLNYDPCHYGTSGITFRGPPVTLDAPYTVVVGGSEVYGKYVADPFCARLAARSDRRIVNLGVMNGGIDVFLREESLMEVIRGADVAIVQAMGAGNLSNRFYSVHPRRNDRYLRPSRLMRKAFPEIDFSTFVFTRHLLHTLETHAPGGLDVLRTELQVAWAARMRQLLEQVSGTKILLRIAHAPDDRLGPEPLYVNDDMLDGLSGLVDGMAKCDVTPDMTEAAMEGMVFPEIDRLVARRMLTPAAHGRIADALAAALRRARDIAA
jgi:hypothetical protein